MATRNHGFSQTHSVWNTHYVEHTVQTLQRLQTCVKRLFCGRDNNICPHPKQNLASAPRGPRSSCNTSGVRVFQHLPGSTRGGQQPGELSFTRHDQATCQVANRISKKCCQTLQRRRPQLILQRIGIAIPMDLPRCGKVEIHI